MKAKEVNTVIYSKLGIVGRMISGSKSAYHRQYPSNFVIFNANIFIDTDELCGKVWHGDIDLTRDCSVLNEIAEELGTTLYVLYEMDGRFDNEDRKDFKDAAAWNTHTGISKKYEKFFDENLLLKKQD
jgi:phage tail tube protein FII